MNTDCVIDSVSCDSRSWVCVLIKELYLLENSIFLVHVAFHILEAKLGVKSKVHLFARIRFCYLLLEKKYDLIRGTMIGTDWKNFRSFEQFLLWKRTISAADLQM